MLIFRTPVLAVIVPAIVLLTGCTGYVLHGQAVRGSHSHVALINTSTNPSGEGIGGVRIAVYRDPGRLSQELVATGRSEPDGTFAIRLPAFGAGWMEEEWLVQATREGYQSAEGVFALPFNSRSRPVLIMLSPGRSIPFEHRDHFMRDFERFQ